MCELVAMSKTNGELIILHPLFTEPKGDTVETLQGFKIVAFAEKQKPKGYAIEHPDGCMVIGPNISNIIEILGELE